MERIRIFPICGFLYGGSSKVNVDGIPFNTVFDSSFEIMRVRNIPSSIISKTVIVASKEAPKWIPSPPINILASVISNGKRPLQGTNALVSMAINLSLGEFIILHPITPAALQPNPMHMGVTRW